MLRIKWPGRSCGGKTGFSHYHLAVRGGEASGWRGYWIWCGWVTWGGHGLLSFFARALSFPSHLIPSRSETYIYLIPVSVFSFLNLFSFSRHKKKRNLTTETLCVEK